MTVLQSKEKTVIESQSEEGLDVRLFFFQDKVPRYTTARCFRGSLFETNHNKQTLCIAFTVSLRFIVDFKPRGMKTDHPFCMVIFLATVQQQY